MVLFKFVSFYHWGDNYRLVGVIKAVQGCCQAAPSQLSEAGSWMQAVFSSVVLCMNVPGPLFPLYRRLESHRMPRKERSPDQGTVGKGWARSHLGRRQDGRCFQRLPLGQ